MWNRLNLPTICSAKDDAMPIEIKELIIRAAVTDQAKKKGSKKPAEDRSLLVEECVAQVLEVLRKERER